MKGGTQGTDHLQIVKPAGNGPFLCGRSPSVRAAWRRARLVAVTAQNHAFEEAFSQAQDIISSMPGYISHQLQRCIEVSGRYVLLVNWRQLEDHTIGFRQSPQYQEWKALLHHFYDPFPNVEHYKGVFSQSVQQIAAADRTKPHVG